MRTANYDEHKYKGYDVRHGGRGTRPSTWLNLSAEKFASSQRCKQIDRMRFQNAKSCRINHNNMYSSFHGAC